MLLHASRALVLAGHLSETLAVPLVTCDRRLAGALGHRGRVEPYDGE